MSTSDLRQKSADELTVLLRDKQETLRKLRFKDSERQLKSVRDIRKLRREIAQIRTILEEKMQSSQSDS